MGEGADSDAGEDMWMMWLGAATQCASLCLPESWPWGFHLHRPRLILLQLVVTVGQQWHSTAAALPGPCARIRFSANLKLNAAGEAHLVRLPVRGPVRASRSLSAGSSGKAAT